MSSDVTPPKGLQTLQSVTTGKNEIHPWTKVSVPLQGLIHRFRVDVQFVFQLPHRRVTSFGRDFSEDALDPLRVEKPVDAGVRWIR